MNVTKLITLALILGLTAFLGACSSDDDPTAPGGNNGTRDPVLYEVQIDLGYIGIEADCDKDPIIGGPNPGEFDATIVIWARDANDKYQKIKELTPSFERSGGSTYTVEKSYSFRVLAGKNYYVGFKATEKDGIGNADDYVGYAQDVNKAGGQLDYNHTLTIGSGGCEMFLKYTATEIPVI